MKQLLEGMLSFLLSNEVEESSNLAEEVKAWLEELQPTEYTCLGCKYCFPAMATNILSTQFPSLFQAISLRCDFDVKKNIWPPVAGEYFAFCEGLTCPIAVSTLASVKLAETLAHIKPKGLCIVGKTETENIGIDKVVKNIITNPTIHYLIVAGQDPQGHHSGKTLLALSEKGVDKYMRVISSPGRRPILRNITLSETESFRSQVQVVNMIGCEEPKKIITKIDELSEKGISTCECKECHSDEPTLQILSVPKFLAATPKKVKMDKAGYFIVIPSLEKKIITVEHYGYDNKLLHIIEGKDAPSIYSKIIENGWVTELSHSAYLGRELAKAEFSLKHGLKYIQDKAPG